MHKARRKATKRKGNQRGEPYTNRHLSRAPIPLLSSPSTQKLIILVFSITTGQTWMDRSNYFIRSLTFS